MSMNEPNGRFGDIWRRIGALEERMNSLGPQIAKLEGRFESFESTQTERHHENLSALQDTKRETSSNRRWIIGAVVIPLMVSLVQIAILLSRH